MNPTEIHDGEIPNEQFETYCLNCKTEMEVSGLEEFSLQNCPACGHQIVIPRIFGNYHIIEHISQSTFYDTYKAYKVNDKYRLVTLKVFNNHAGIHENNLMNFVQLLEQFCPSGIPGTVESDGIKVIYGHAVLIRPWIEKTAIQFLHEKNFNKQSACRLMYEILETLGNMENLRIFPVELKLSNILIDKQNKVVISDTGIAQTLFTMGGNQQEYLASYFDINNLHNFCLSEVRNHINCTAFTCANLFYSLCSGGSKLYSATNIQELLHQRQNFQINVPFRLEGTVPEYLDQEISSLFQFEGNGITLKDKASVFKRFLAQTKTPKKNKAPNRPVQKSKYKKSPKKNSSMMVPVLAILFLGAVIGGVFFALGGSEDTDNYTATTNKQPVAQGQAVIIGKADVAPVAQSAAAPTLAPTPTPPPAKKTTPEVIKAKDTAVLKSLPTLEQPATPLNGKSMREWQLQDGPVVAAFSNLSRSILTLKTEDDKSLKIHQDSLNNVDTLFLESASTRIWSINDNSFLNLTYLKSDAAKVYFLDKNDKSITINLTDLATSDKILVNVISYRDWKDNGGNSIKASLLKISGGTAFLKTPGLMVLPVSINSLDSSSQELIESYKEDLEFIDKINQAREAFNMKEFSISRSHYLKSMAYMESEEISDMLKKIEHAEQDLANN